MALSRNQHKLGVISTMGNLNHLWGLYLFSIKEPLFLRIRFTANINFNDNLLIYFDNFLVKVSSVNLWRCKPGLHQMRCGMFWRITKASFIFCLCPEFILLTRSEIFHLTIRVLLCFHPWSNNPVVSSIFSVLNSVMSNRSAILSQRWCPLQLDRIFSPVWNFRKSRWARGVKWVFDKDWF